MTDTPIQIAEPFAMVNRDRRRKARWPSPFKLLAVVGLGCLLGHLFAPLAEGAAPACKERQLEVEGRSRSYILCIPSRPLNPAPVVFVFHGGGGSAEEAHQRSGWDRIGEREGVLTLFPNGCEKKGCSGGSWNADSDPPSGWAEKRRVDDKAFVAAILAQVQAEIPVDRKRIYAVGHSKGGMFSYSLACDMSGVFAAIGPSAAALSDVSCTPSEPVSVIHIQGADDPAVPLEGGRKWPSPLDGLRKWARLVGCADSERSTHDDGTTRCQAFTGCNGGRTVEYCLVAGARHRFEDLNRTMVTQEYLWRRFRKTPSSV